MVALVSSVGTASSRGRFAVYVFDQYPRDFDPHGPGDVPTCLDGDVVCRDLGLTESKAVAKAEAINRAQLALPASQRREWAVVVLHRAADVLPALPPVR
jgi:hypothetical protein